MKEEDKLIELVGRKDGRTVPEGYFADFAAHMTQSLPSTPFEESAKTPKFVPKRTFWQRIRPYAYMAAMFAGVWCMLKMFSMMTQQPADDTFQVSPGLAEALGNDTFVNDYIISDVNQWDLMDQMMEEGFDFSQISDAPSSDMPTEIIYE